MTDTLDKTGEVIETTENIPTEQQIRSVLDNFVGEIEQRLIDICLIYQYRHGIIKLYICSTIFINGGFL